jgi:hypothetical protein
VRAPRGGLWALVLALNPPLRGPRVQEAFTGTIDFAVPSIAGSPPNSTSIRLAAGIPVTVPIHVMNTGVSPKAYFVDPRLDQRATLTLAGLSTTNIPLPLRSGDPTPVFLVPTDSVRLTMVGNGSSPFLMTAAGPFGSPGIVAHVSTNTATASLALPAIAPGTWSAQPALVGPFSDGGTSPATATVTATVETNDFDPAITSDTGDFWLASVTPLGSFSPLILDPGQSGTINVSITPSAPVGTKVKGSLEIDTVDPSTLTGDTLAALPYAYQVR